MCGGGEVSRKGVRRVVEHRQHGRGKRTLQKHTRRGREPEQEEWENADGNKVYAKMPQWSLLL